eukprot:4917107-Prymnesium_polylepis.1
MPSTSFPGNAPLAPCCEQTAHLPPLPPRRRAPTLSSRGSLPSKRQWAPCRTAPDRRAARGRCDCRPIQRGSAPRGTERPPRLQHAPRRRIRGRESRSAARRAARRRAAQTTGPCTGGQPAQARRARRRDGQRAQTPNRESTRSHRRTRGSCNKHARGGCINSQPSTAGLDRAAHSTRPWWPSKSKFCSALSSAHRSSPGSTRASSSARASLLGLTVFVDASTGLPWMPAVWISSQVYGHFLDEPSGAGSSHILAPSSTNASMRPGFTQCATAVLPPSRATSATKRSRRAISVACCNVAA